MGGQSNQQEARLEDFARGLRKGTKGPRDALLAQTLEALQTGGVNARIPIIQRAVEENNAAASQALAGTDSRLGLLKLAGTPYGERIRAGVQEQGQLSNQNVKTSIINQLLQGAPGLLTSLTSLAGNETGAAAQLKFNVEQFNDEQAAKFYQDLKQSFQSAGGGGGGQGGSYGTSSAPVAQSSSVNVPQYGGGGTGAGYGAPDDYSRSAQDWSFLSGAGAGA